MRFEADVRGMLTEVQTGTAPDARAAKVSSRAYGITQGLNILEFSGIRGLGIPANQLFIDGHEVSGALDSRSMAFEAWTVPSQKPHSTFTGAETLNDLNLNSSIIPSLSAILLIERLSRLAERWCGTFFVFPIPPCHIQAVVCTVEGDFTVWTMEIGTGQQAIGRWQWISLPPKLPSFLAWMLGRTTEMYRVHSTIQSTEGTVPFPERLAGKVVVIPAKGVDCSGTGRSL